MRKILPVSQNAAISDWSVDSACSVKWGTRFPFQPRRRDRTTMGNEHSQHGSCVSSRTESGACVNSSARNFSYIRFLFSFAVRTPDKMLSKT